MCYGGGRGVMSPARGLASSRSRASSQSVWGSCEHHEIGPSRRSAVVCPTDAKAWFTIKSRGSPQVAPCRSGYHSRVSRTCPLARQHGALPSEPGNRRGSARTRWVSSGCTGGAHVSGVWRVLVARPAGGAHLGDDVSTRGSRQGATVTASPAGGATCVRGRRASQGLHPRA
jgi:hypothetical protein